MTPHDAERAFFSALVAADRAGLDAVLDDDFVLVDVLAGGVVGRGELLAAVADGQLRFDRVEPEGAPHERRFGGVAVLVGATRMTGTFEGAPWDVHSRYSHVLVGTDAGGWRLASAQGTPIAGDRRDG